MQMPRPSLYGPNGSSGSDRPAPNPSNGTAENEEDDDIAFAAEAAANAVEEADAEQQRLDQSMLRCRICGQGADGRPLLRFQPMDPALAAYTIQSLPQSSPSSEMFSKDICLHIFCGKTASILPSVRQPELEILTKAGLKNKHGIGAEVNGALARTRCASLVTLNHDSEETMSSAKQDKQFYLVREFELHLAAIRTNYPNTSEHAMAPHTPLSNAALAGPSGNSNGAYAGSTANNEGLSTNIQNSSSVCTRDPGKMAGNDSSASASNSFQLHGSVPPGGTHVNTNGPLRNPLNTKADTSSSAGNQIRTVVNGMSNNTGSSGMAMPPTGMMVGPPSMLGSTAAAAAGYPALSLGQLTPQHGNFFSRPSSNAMISNNNFQPAVGQMAVPPPIGAVPLRPQLPQAQQFSSTQNAPTSVGFKSTCTNDGATTSNNGRTRAVGMSGGLSDKSALALPKRATAGRTVSKPQIINTIIAYQAPDHGLDIATGEGKVKCGCGGTYLQSHTSKGAASWRNHVVTKRHQKWMESKEAERGENNDL